MRSHAVRSCIRDVVETMPSQDMEQIQVERLRAGISRLSKRVPFYREKLREMLRRMRVSAQRGHGSPTCSCIYPSTCRIASSLKSTSVGNALRCRRQTIRRLWPHIATGATLSLRRESTRR
jgi:hypothetical protein